MKLAELDLNKANPMKRNNFTFTSRVCNGPTPWISPTRKARQLWKTAIMFDLAECLMTQGKKQEAVEIFRRIMRLGNKDSTFRAEEKLAELAREKQP